MQGAPYAFPAAVKSTIADIRVSTLTMQRTVKAHIEELELLVHQLNEELMQQEDVRARNALEARVRAADQALQHFQAALALEQRVRQKS